MRRLNRSRLSLRLLASLTAAVAVAAGAATPPPAHASSVWGRGEIVNWDRACIDVRGAQFSDGTAAQLYACNSTPAQRWSLNDDSTITAGGLCLDASGWGRSAGTPLIVWRCHGGTNQAWAALPDGQLRNPASGLCVTAPTGRETSGTQLVLGRCTAPGEPVRRVQQWVLPWGRDLPSTPQVPASPQPVGQTDGGWHLTFRDEFDGTGVDPAKWRSGWFAGASQVSGPVNTHELACYDARNVGVSGGVATLALRRPTQGITCSGATRPYSGALLTTNDTYRFTHGYAEARMYLPGSGGRIDNWPAFWLDGQVWPQNGEIDVMEGLGGSACFHFHATATEAGGCAPGDFTGWHVFGAEWESGAITYYYDGVRVGSVTRNVTNDPMYLIVGASAGSPDPESPNPLPPVAPSDVKVDHVRVWQR